MTKTPSKTAAKPKGVVAAPTPHAGTTITTLETAELLGISIQALHKRIGQPNSKLKPVESSGRGNKFDLDQVIAYAAEAPERVSNKPDPMLRMREVAQTYIERGIKVWTITDKKDPGHVLGVLPGNTEDQAVFNAKRRFKDTEFTVAPFENASA